MKSCSLIRDDTRRLWHRLKRRVEPAYPYILTAVVVWWGWQVWIELVAIRRLLEP